MTTDDIRKAFMTCINETTDYLETHDSDGRGVQYFMGLYDMADKLIRIQEARDDLEKGMT